MANKSKKAAEAAPGLPGVYVFCSPSVEAFRQDAIKAVSAICGDCPMRGYDGSLEGASAVLMVTGPEADPCCDIALEAAEARVPVFAAAPDPDGAQAAEDVLGLPVCDLSGEDFDRRARAFFRFAAVSSDVVSRIESARAREGMAEATITDLYYMGRGVLDGVGCPRDGKRGCEMIKASTFAGLLEAKRMLAFMYRFGKGVAADEGAADEWSDKALSQARTLYNKNKNDRNAEEVSDIGWFVAAMCRERGDYAREADCLENIYQLWAGRDPQRVAECAYAQAMNAVSRGADAFAALEKARCDAETFEAEGGSALNRMRLADACARLAALSAGEDDYASAREYAARYDALMDGDLLAETRNGYMLGHLEAGDALTEAGGYEAAREEYAKIVAVCEEMVEEGLPVEGRPLTAYFKLGFMDERAGDLDAAQKMYLRYAMIFLGAGSNPAAVLPGAAPESGQEEMFFEEDEGDFDAASGDETDSETEPCADADADAEIAVLEAETDEQAEAEADRAADADGAAPGDLTDEASEAGMDEAAEEAVSEADAADMEGERPGTEETEPGAEAGEPAGDGAEEAATQEGALTEAGAAGKYTQTELESMAKSAANYALMARSLESGENYERAKNWCIEAIKLRREIYKTTNADPARAALGMSVMMLAGLNERLGETEDAIKNYDAAMRLISPLAGNDAVLYDAMGRGYLSLGRASQSAADVAAAIAVWSELLEKTRDEAFAAKIREAQSELDRLRRP